MRFDEAVLACHGDEVLPLLADATPASATCRGVPDQPRRYVAPLRQPPAADPPRPPGPRGTIGSTTGREASSLTYHMNRLQKPRGPEDYCVTLKPGGLVDDGNVIAKLVYQHPIYTTEALRAQRRWAEVSGVRRTHYCGAYWFDGFHEDGVRSALRVAKAIGA